MWPLLLLILTSLLVLAYRRRRAHFALFRRLGLPGPVPSLLTGSLLEISRLGYTEAFRGWQRRFGATYGYFYGLRPVIVTTDGELLHKVIFKDAHLFYSRTFQFNLDTPHPVSGKQLHILRDPAQIKAIRTQFTSAFTSNKLKKVTKTQEESIRIFLSVVESLVESGKDFEISEPFKRLAMDAVSRTSFGLALPVQTVKEVPEILHLCEVLALENLNSKQEFIATCLPLSVTQPILKALYALKLLANNIDPLTKKLGAIINARKANPSRRDDIIDNFLHKQILGRQMTDAEMVANATAAYFAGFETSAVTLAIVTFRLGRHPDWQEKVRAEIREVWNEADLYESISNLKLLDRFVSESLRMDPPAPAFVMREAAEDYRYGNLLIPKGTSVQAPLTVLQRDPRVFPNPDEFNPDHFSEHFPPVYYMPFGEGPRNCVGMRFALTLVKQSIARLLQNYRVHLGEQLEDLQEPPLEDSGILRRPTSLPVRLEKLSA